MAVVYMEYLFKEADTKELACKVVLSIVIRGQGGFGKTTGNIQTILYKILKSVFISQL